MKTIENIIYGIKHIRGPIATKSKEWRDAADQWLVTFKHGSGFFTVDYYTGVGHRKKDRPVKPDIKGVLHSLYMDSSACYENFDDWCDNCGYSSDSIRALNIYKACLENGRKLKLLGLSRDYLDEIFQDY